MKRSDFQQSEEFMASLTEILRTPVMRAAIEVIKAESVGLPDPTPGVDYQQQVAVCGAYTAGAFRAFDKLESLARPPSTPSILPRGNQFDDAARERMRAAGIYSEKEINDLTNNE
jgi:hypothetical protein